MTEYGAYMGKVLMIDLNTRTTSEYPWTDKDRHRTIGGKIMAGTILLDHVRPGMTAYDEDNWIVITTGPLTGTGTPSTSRFNISTISPLTGLVTSSNSGGDFGLMLKRCGYDGCIITGKSETPVHIEITEDEVLYHDASELWGLEVTPTQEALPKGHGANLVIGPGGENKVLYAAVMSGERAHGRGGVGAVFGDKKIKAITAKGFKHPRIADEPGLRKLNRKWCKTMRNHALTGRQVPQLGTAGLVTPMQARNILATKNFTQGQFDGFDDVSGETLAETRLLRNSGCTTCVIQCTRRCEVNGKDVKGPELEILGLMGPNFMNNDLDAIIRWNWLIDEMGMDTISIAGTLAYAMEANEKGLWDNGLEFGKIDNIDQMIEDIAHRRGDVANELANGSKRCAEKYGGMDFAIKAKGMELSAYEPRAAFGQGLGYATSNRGGCHLNAGYLVFAEGLGLDMNGVTPLGKANLSIMFQNLMEAISAAGACLFTSYPVFPTFVFDRPNNPITKLVNWILPHLGKVIFLLNYIYPALQMQLFLIPHSSAVHKASGMKMTLGDFLVAGDRGWNTERVCNIILGQKPGADTLPKKLTDEVQHPGTEKSVPLGVMLKSFYRNRGWVNGVPTLWKLATLGIKVPKEYRKLFPGGI